MGFGWVGAGLGGGPVPMLDERAWRRRQQQGCPGNRCRIDLPLFREWPANETSKPWGWLCRAAGSAKKTDSISRCGLQRIFCLSTLSVGKCWMVFCCSME